MRYFSSFMFQIVICGTRWSSGYKKATKNVILFSLTDVLCGASLWCFVLPTWSCIIRGLCEFWSVLEFKVLINIIRKRTNDIWRWRFSFWSFCWELCVGKTFCPKSSSGNLLYVSHLHPSDWLPEFLTYFCLKVWLCFSNFSCDWLLSLYLFSAFHLRNSFTFLAVNWMHWCLCFCQHHAKKNSSSG